MLKRIKYTEIFFHLFFWIISFVAINSSSDLRIGVFNTESGSLQGALYYSLFFHALIFYGCLYVILRWYEQIGLKTFLICAAIYLFATIMESLVDMFFINHFYYDPRYSWRIEYFLGANLIVHIAFIALAYIYGTINLKLKIEKNKQNLIIEKLDAELKFLKMQISPHFLFNTLNNLYGLARKENAPMASNGIAKLSILMRYIIYEGRNDFISVEKEIEFINTYIEIQNLRFAETDDISINFETEGSFEKKKIPPLLLIILVENAIKHGIQIEKKSKVNINLIIDAENLKFYVENTTHKNIENKVSQPLGLGLENLRNRLNYLLPAGHNLELEEKNNMFKASLSLKL